MVFTNEGYLPTFEELEIEELPLTSSVLRAGSYHFGKYCDEQCKEYILCIKETADLRRCIPEGKDVTKCAFKFFGRVKDQCYEPFTKYFECIDHAGREMSLSWCRKTQKVFDTCMKTNLSMDRPPVGYFSQPRLHKTDRQKTFVKPHKLPEGLPDLPDLTKEPDSKVKWW